MTSPPPQSPERWTTRKLLAFTYDYLEKKGVDSARLASEMLLAHVLKCERLKLFMEMDRPASPEEREAYRELVKRAGEHEPVDYLVEVAPFYGKNFKVGPQVLIPRPSTETLIDEALKLKEDLKKGALAADIGTGSGIIAITLALNLPELSLYAVDISQDALAVAQENASTLKVNDRITFLEGSLLSPLEEVTNQHGLLDLIASNPPYIPDHEWSDVAPNVKDFEPHLALRGGEDGMDLLRPIVQEAARFLKPGGHLMLEIASCQVADMLDMVSSAGFIHGRIEKDHEGLDRILVAQKKPEAE